MDLPEVIAPHPAMRTMLVPGEELWAVVLDERSGAEHRLNSSAAAVWALIDGPRAFDDLAGDVAATFGIDPAVAEPLVESAIGAFAEQGLLDLGDPPITDVGHDDAPLPLPREPDP